MFALRNASDYAAAATEPESKRYRNERIFLIGDSKCRVLANLLGETVGGGVAQSGSSSRLRALLQLILGRQLAQVAKLSSIARFSPDQAHCRSRLEQGQISSQFIRLSFSGAERRVVPRPGGLTHRTGPAPPLWRSLVGKSIQISRIITVLNSKVEPQAPSDRNLVDSDRKTFGAGLRIRTSAAVSSSSETYCAASPWPQHIMQKNITDIRKHHARPESP